MVLRLNSNMSDLEIAEIQEKNNADARREAIADSKAKVDAILAIEKSDQKIIDSQEKAKLEAENATIKLQNDLREKYLSTPLTEGERVELLGLEAMAQDGHNPDKGNMFRLADLRKKSKIKAKTKDK
jgi:uncharacterized protein involved in exopolysaccharide biosynthesis